MFLFIYSFYLLSRMITLINYIFGNLDLENLKLLAMLDYFDKNVNGEIIMGNSFICFVVTNWLFIFVLKSMTIWVRNHLVTLDDLVKLNHNVNIKNVKPYDMGLIIKAP